MQEYTIPEFASLKGITPGAVKLMIWRDKLPEGYIVIEQSKRKRIIVEKQETEQRTSYKGAAKLTAEEIINIENAYVDYNGNISQISKACNLNYWTVRRYILKQYKPKDQSRSDKGESRKLKNISNDKKNEIKDIFLDLLLKNVQRNVKLTIEKVEQNTGIRIPQRIAYTWAKGFIGIHKQYHYYQKACLENNIHVVRDLWTEYKNFLDCVMADEWKIDEFGVWVHWKDPNYEKTIATAYLVAFFDVKTRYPLSLVVTPHSTTTSDTMKAAMELIRDWGLPKQWLFEHGKTWKSDQFLRFLHGLYDENSDKNIEFMDYDKLVVIDRESEHVHRARVKHPQAKPIERLWRIIKDEFCAYSPSYSPSPELSRKPTLYDAHPEVHRTFEQLRIDLMGFIYNDFITRERTMFFDRRLSSAHDVNKARPKTIKEAFDIAYATYNRINVDPFKLAYHYGEKFTKKYKNGTISFIYPTSKEKMFFIPEDPVAVSEFTGQNLTVIINQYDIYTGWIFNDRKLLCACQDMRRTGVISRDQANAIGKLNRQVEKYNKKKAEALRELDKTKQIKVFKYETVLPEAVENNDSEYAITADGDLVDKKTNEVKISNESEPSIDLSQQNSGTGKLIKITLDELIYGDEDSIE